MLNLRTYEKWNRRELFEGASDVDLIYTDLVSYSKRMRMEWRQKYLIWIDWRWNKIRCHKSNITQTWISIHESGAIGNWTKLKVTKRIRRQYPQSKLKWFELGGPNSEWLFFALLAGDLRKTRNSYVNNKRSTEWYGQSKGSDDLFIISKQ